MNKAFIFTSLLLASGALNAQVPAQPPNFARYQPTYDDLKSALSLSDDQIAKLKQMQQDKMTATQAFYAKLAEKQRELNQLLETNSNDAQHVGQLMIELQTMRKQPPPEIGDVRDRAIGVLQGEQKTKLEKLEEAQKLRPAIEQATQLGLLKPPAPTQGPRPGAVGPVPSAPKPAAQGK